VYALESTSDDTLAERIRTTCCENFLVVETCGSKDQVLKLLPPLTIPDAQLIQGLEIIRNAVDSVIAAENASHTTPKAA
jgi:diaminobutyrate-2-oxoglutarate transaminase